jgi:glycosyltransferase involved in cell wall biosynthesis
MGAASRPRIVVSAVNFTEFGPLSILSEVLGYLRDYQAEAFEIVALVHRKDLVRIPQIRYFEFPNCKKSWLSRLTHEFHHFHALSKELDPFLWLSLHDISPRVVAKRQAVYCHNPSPFFSLTARQALRDPKFACFNKLYGHLYRVNIKANDFVIVQQDWIRRQFERRFELKNVIVAHPEVGRIDPPVETIVDEEPRFRFFYPCSPRVFKNLETVLSAVALLDNAPAFEFRLTFDGTESGYAKSLRERFRDLKALRFSGRMSRADVFKEYHRTDCLVFASKLETWGLPITEFGGRGKPMLLADMPYAHETAGGLDNVAFFPPDDAAALARMMRQAIAGRLPVQRAETPVIAPPFAKGWADLFSVLLG